MLNGLMRFVYVYFFDESPGFIFRRVGPFEGEGADNWARDIRQIAYEKGIDVTAVPSNFKNYSNADALKPIDPEEFIKKLISEHK